MLKQYEFKYGNEILKIHLEEDSILEELQPKYVEPIEDLKSYLFSLLDNPIASKAFNEIFFKGDKVAIIVSDITRLWIKTSKYLPFIVERLNTIGINDEDIMIIIATGTHRGHTEKELDTIVGREVFNRIKVVEHDCDGELTYVGTTSRGTVVEVNKLLTGRKTILTGGIVHHLMAGYGGGRKSILPGVSGRKTIEQNHLHALDPIKEQSNPLIGAGVTLNNPINLDMIEAGSFINPDFLINSIVDSLGNIVSIVAGHWLSAWEEGCRYVDENFGVTIHTPADTVIVSCGGFPKDIALYQAVKSLFNAALATKPGGTILLLAECREGGGADEFFNWINPLVNGNLDSALRKNFTIPGYIFYAAVELASKCNVVLLSSISSEIVEPMGIKATNSLDTALKLAKIDKNAKEIIVMPFGGSTVPILK